MKKALLSVLSSLLLFVPHPSWAKTPPDLALPFPVTESTDVRYIEVKAGLNEDFIIELETDLDSGYVWSECQELPPGITFVSSEFKANESIRSPFGTPGVERRRYHLSDRPYNRPLMRAYIFLRLARPWEKNRAPAAYSVCRVNIQVPSPGMPRIFAIHRKIYQFRNRPWIVIFLGRDYEAAKFWKYLFTKRPKAFWRANLAGLCLFFIMMHLIRSKNKNYWSVGGNRWQYFLFVSFLLALLVVLYLWVRTMWHMAIFYI